MAERNTVQKDIVRSALVALHDHPTAEQLYDHIHAVHPSVSRATVYRVLGQMVHNGSVLRIPVADGADHFDHQTHRHDHVRCTRCGRVDDVVLEFSGCPAVRDRCGYALTGYTLLLHGLCPVCQKSVHAGNPPAV